MNANTNAAPDKSKFIYNITKTALFTVLIAAVAGAVLFSGSVWLSKYQSRKDDREMAKEVLSLLEQQLKLGERVSVSDFGSEPVYGHYIIIKNGKLLFDGEDAYPKAAKAERKISVSVEAANLTLKTTVFIMNSDGGVMAKATGDIRVNMLQLFNDVIEGDKNIKISNPVLSYEGFAEQYYSGS